MTIAAIETAEWYTKGVNELSTDSFKRLLRGEIPYVRIPGFAESDECEALVEKAVEEGFSSYRGVEPIINRIGNTVFEYNRLSRGKYFENNFTLRDVQRRIFRSSFDPLERFLKLLSEKTGKTASVAKNLTGVDYYAGLIRRIEQGTLLHVDYAPGEQPGWEVSSIREQLSWNLYLRASNPNSGKTHVFDRQWKKEDDRFKEGIYGYNRSIVKDAGEAVFSSLVGDVVIFNTRNYHFVEPTEGERVAFTSAIGCTHLDELVIWS